MLLTPDAGPPDTRIGSRSAGPLRGIPKLRTDHMPISAFPFEVKQLDEKGVFEGLAATYMNVDQGSDRVMPGAFSSTLAAGKQRPLLIGHKDAIGVVELSDSPQGLVARGKLTLAVQAARETYALMKDGAIRGLSIGFLAIREDLKDGVRQLLECKLFEVSLTPFPMNEMAVVTSVKSAQHHQQIQTALQSFHRELLSALEKRQN